MKTDFLSRLLYGVIMACIVGLTVIMIGLPWIVEGVAPYSDFVTKFSTKELLILLYITGVPAWCILWMTRGLAKNIIKREPFSLTSVSYLKCISICSVLICVCYAYTSLFIEMTLGGVAISLAAFIVGLIAAILHRLVQMAMEIKEENELTI